MAQIIKPIPTKPELLALLAKAKDHVMTAEEKSEQRISWVRGELMMQFPEMTLEEADRRVREAA
ncbi:MAG TPA: hypothetical protein DCW88_14190 [Agrobacterium sp.]|uniref:hypothetical protein n=1 Tax=Agrobacterium pusense TaxID=648995 RepID=UPI000E9A1F27|nr:hypothetical protein [Agrobacterium pusense]MDH1267057.1 hypothetical protein [Agrobacterium pusense]HAU76626.1 hypothetical protein [Agrobacterium sp.]